MASSVHPSSPANPPNKLSNAMQVGMGNTACVTFSFFLSPPPPTLLARCLALNPQAPFDGRAGGHDSPPQPGIHVLVNRGFLLPIRYFLFYFSVSKLGIFLEHQLENKERMETLVPTKINCFRVVARQPARVASSINVHSSIPPFLALSLHFRTVTRPEQRDRKKKQENIVKPLSK